MNRLNIAIANMYEKMQGVTNVALSYRKALEESGHIVSFIQFSIGNEENFLSPTNKGVNLLSRKLSKAFNILFTFPKTLSKTKADILVLSDPWLLKAAKYRNDCVLIFHDARQLTIYRDGITSAILFKHLLKYLELVKAVIAVSDVAKNQLIRLGVKENKIYVVQNSFERPELPLDRQDMNSDDSRDRVFNVYYVASNQRHKNIDFFLNIAKAIHNDGNFSGIHFYLVSNIDANKTGRYGDILGKGLTILNKVEDMNKFLVKMDLLIFPSDYEGFGLPLIEAMSFGIPVISRDLPITKEILGESGTFLKGLEVEKWMQAMLKFRDGTYYEHVSKLSFTRSLDFDFTRFMEKVNKTIGEISIGGRQRFSD